MLWRGRRESSNVETRSGKGGLVAGGGIGGIVIALVIYLLGGNSGELQNQINNTGEERIESPAEADTLSQYVKVVLADTEDVWNKLFRDELKAKYEEPTMVMFNRGTQSGCGSASSSTGPFYCPADRKVYLDVSFFREMRERFGASGDFAAAYVVAHEVGHHIQNLLGISDQVSNARGNLSEKEFNRLSVKLELQADFLAGVWAHHNQKLNGVLQDDDIAEAMNAANAIGDDRLQEQSQGQVVPDAFTHGTSAQRMKWFKKGFETGDMKQGDTFNSNDL